MDNVRKLLVISTPDHPSIKWWADGIKNVYVHINIGKWKEMKVGDKVILEDINSEEYVKGEIVFKHEYGSYENLIKSEGVKNIFPYLEDNDIGKAVKYFKNFPGSDLVKPYGCIAFGIEVSDKILLQ